MPLVGFLKIIRKEKCMKNSVQTASISAPTDRRSFLKKGVVTAGVAAAGAGFLSNGLPVFAKEDEKSGRLRKGDAAILRFLAAAEILETDLWQQYNELGEFKTVKSQEGVEAHLTSLLFYSLTRICPSIFMIIRKTN
jgi:hypothetical protein